MRNRLKEMLKAGKTALGVWISTGCPEVVWALMDSGVDWLLFDTEHGPCSIETVDKLIQYMRGSKATPIIRVVWNDLNAIKRALDTGAYGVVIPWVSSREEAVQAVRYCRYPPDGIRGAAPGRPARRWGITSNEYLRCANDEILIIIQIEREEAVNNIEDILSVDGVDVALIGPTDLSMSMGLVGRPFHPKVVEAMDRVIDACKEAGVTPGIAYALNPEHANQLISKGFRFISIGSDVGFLLNACLNTLRAIRGES